MKQMELAFEIDKLTNSIENAVSGEVFDTVVSLVESSKNIKKPIGCLTGIKS
jgi:hypothetical protein